ncbi:Lsr2 family protein [Mycobacterium sp. CnD-18-1]|uniref:histone-like nucleoid-structuring protein Lsr2 n=1 Tax=Mycobacterium sp. CnD-18-1 TaxID=2917744 RepID=UPI001EF36452|nr:Lsr2 family protein [Mycobacterium sp. CnD-18-1]MCG7607062.1 Lsr2 family protein [Mycobacterium sp. CnD-18-1]
MAVKHVTIDDLDGSEGAETRTFSIEGAVYEIDLIDAHAKELYRALEPYIESARRITGTRARKAAPQAVAKKPSAPAKTEQNTAIREWARKKGMDVSNRGRISADIVDAFEAAHKSDNLFSAGV